jgi:hypothetical protein
MSSLDDKSDAATDGLKKKERKKKMEISNPSSPVYKGDAVKPVIRTPLQRYWFTWQVVTSGLLFFFFLFFFFFGFALLVFWALFFGICHTVWSQNRSRCSYSLKHLCALVQEEYFCCSASNSFRACA